MLTHAHDVTGFRRDGSTPAAGRAAVCAWRIASGGGADAGRDARQCPPLVPRVEEEGPHGSEGSGGRGPAGPHARPDSCRRRLEAAVGGGGVGLPVGWPTHTLLLSHAARRVHRPHPHRVSPAAEASLRPSTSDPHLGWTAGAQESRNAG